MAYKRTPEQLKRHREYMKKYAETHPAYRNEQNKKRCERQVINREATSERWNQWYRETKELRRAKARENRKKLREETLRLLGGKCSCCGEDRFEFLAIDHKNGGGLAHRKAVKWSGSYVWLVFNEIKAGSDKYRALCHNCNSAIGFYGYCPHETEKFDIAGVAC